MRRALSLLALAALGACSMAPRYVRPELPVPPSWPAGDAYLRQSEAALPSITYRDIFRDPRLQSLIDRALIENRDALIDAIPFMVAAGCSPAEAARLRGLGVVDPKMVARIVADDVADEYVYTMVRADNRLSLVGV